MYSLAENPSMTLKEAEALLDQSCESTRDLYLFLLAIVSPLTREAKARIEAARSKFNPSEQELNPNMKFVENQLAVVLDSDPDFQKIISRKKLSWAQYDVLLRTLYETVKTRPYYQKYMDNPERSIKEDAKLFCDIFANEFEENADLEAILEDLSILWNDDLVYAINVCCRSMEEIGKGRSWSLPELFQSDAKGSDKTQSDKAFIAAILRKGFVNFDKYYQSISGTTPKWDKNRICATDLALIVSGLAESEAFPEVPAGIIINEYVEISKFYSTPESRSFVNGVLDKIINNK